MSVNKAENLAKPFPNTKMMRLLRNGERLGRCNFFQWAGLMRHCGWWNSSLFHLRLLAFASIKGFEELTIKGFEKHEVDFIELVVKDISSKLPAVSADGNLVGMRTRISGMVSSLNAFPNEASMLGIWGMGGIGKTTLARALFDQIRAEFEGSSFVENVRERSNSLLLGLQSLQQQVLRDVFKREDIYVSGVLHGKVEMKKRMYGIKVLVVLDDVDHIDQLKALAGELNWFKSGSKIIITTRDKQVLVAHKVNLIHDASLLTNEEAVCLLSRCAFGKEIPIPGYEVLSKAVVRYAAGLPLTITILGSSLCEAKEHDWIDTIKRLEKIPLKETLQMLELSYMGLDDDCKEIFLDVACIMKGWSRKEAVKALESCGFRAIHGLNVLEKRSLITISKDEDLYMHDHIEEMGRHIVRRSNPDEPERHTRLWIKEEIEDILVNDLGTEATTCITLSGWEVNQKPIIKGLKKMEKLRLLLVNDFMFGIDREFDEDILYLPNSLQYLWWRKYRFCVLPKKFQASNLVALQMPHCSLKQLWEGGERKVLHKLRFLDLSFSLLRTFDLALTPNLETLNLECCRDLVEFHMPLQCPKLKSLNLSDSKLRTVDLRSVPNLEALNLSECPYLVKLNIPSECPKLKSLKASSSKLRSLDLRLVPNIATLNLDGCYHLVELEIPCECPHLINLDDLVELDMPRKCSQLKYLGLSCPAFRSLNLGLGPTSNIETLKQEECDYLDKFDMFLECPQLETLILTIPTLRTLDIGSIRNLKTLDIEGCHNLVELRMPDGCLKLEFINIKRCLELKTLDLRQTPNLKRFRLEECSSLVKLHVPVGSLKKLIGLEAKGFLRFTNLIILRNGGLYPKLTLDGKLVRICPLHPDNNFPKFVFKCSYMEDLHSSMGNIEKLISIGQYSEVPKDLDRLQSLEELTLESTEIKHLPDSICMLKHLKSLNLIRCELLEKLPEDLGRLECLKHLYFTSLMIKHLPDSICMLKYLKHLELYDCELLEKLPQDLGRLECLETLRVEECIVLLDIPNSICRLKRLECFSLFNCKRVEELPNELGRLECLRELDIRGEIDPGLLGERGITYRRLKNGTLRQQHMTTLEEPFYCDVE
ncbi:hypothetical protein OSB04_010964 [Centaurea solstitialis]|uniref:NB-ARC domain-containing protein n=1 Tax=Centaurea solstitialis TaxID=347529 RepID=A0AA38T8J2_9ASTR|nr:hypothetical protein OSB04_010964 [Centaurea solstitialis]